MHIDYETRRRNATRALRTHLTDIDSSPLGSKFRDSFGQAVRRNVDLVNSIEGRFVDGGYLPAADADLVELRSDVVALILGMSLLADFAGYNTIYDDVRAWGYERLGAVDRAILDRGAKGGAS
jgi:hypothetical protein